MRWDDPNMTQLNRKLKEIHEQWCIKINNGFVSVVKLRKGKLYYMFNNINMLNLINYGNSVYVLYTFFNYFLTSLLRDIWQCHVTKFRSWL